jgi:uncharacterized protein
MKKKFSIFLALCLIFLVSPFSVSAQSAETPHILDLYSLLSEDEALTLEAQLATISERYKIDIAVASTESDGEAIEDLAQAFYIYGEYGYGEEKTGILLLYEDTAPDTYLYLSGRATELFPQKIIENWIDHFDSIADGYEAYSAFAQDVDDFLSGISIETEPEPSEPETTQSQESLAPVAPVLPDESIEPDTSTEPEPETESSDDSDLESIAQGYGRLVDIADLLSDSQEKKLKAKLDNLAKTYKCDVVIFTLDSLDGQTAQDYADDLFDYGEYGIGSSHDGILFLLSIEERDWAISTYGFGIKAFTDYGQAYIMDHVLPYLGSDEYYDGFETFATLSGDFLEQARSGAPYDTNNKIKSPKTLEQILFNIGLSLFLGLLAGTIVATILKGQLKSVKQQQLAHEYIRQNSFQVRSGNDQFLYKHITRKEKPKQSSSGSSTHSSSSGRSHGGSSGKF